MAQVSFVERTNCFFRDKEKASENTLIGLDSDLKLHQYPNMADVSLELFKQGSLSPPLINVIHYTTE